MQQSPADGIRVLHVDDDPEFADVAAEFLEREDERFSVETAASAGEGLARVGDVDCIVADYELPGRNGIDFLEAVRGEHPELPFVLLTGEGSEEVAADAISAGVTDYIQKRGGPDQYTTLANRVRNAVEHARARRERRRHLDAIETAREGIGILDAEGRFIYVNDAYAALYGYDPGELVGEHWERLYREGDAAEIRESVLPRLESAGHCHGTAAGLRADGTTFPAEYVFSRTDRRELICTVRDGTDREQLRTKYELVVKASTDAFWEWDAVSEEVSRSEEYLTGFGYEPSDIGADMDWWVERVHPEDRERVIAAIDAALEDPETTYDETYRFRKKDGTYGHVRSRGHVVYDENGESVRMVGAYVDITERVERERELREERDRRAALFENAPVPVTTGEIDRERDQHRITEVNEAFEAVFGLDAADVVGRDVADVVVPGDEREDHEQIRERTAAGEHVEAVVTRQTVDGPREFLLYSIPIVDDGRGEGWYAWYTDLTERRRYEQQLERQNERLEAFSSVVSHDLKNPLGIAQGRLELARRECDSEHLDDVARAHDRMERLIGDLLALAREGKTIEGTTTVDVRECVEDCWRRIETADATLVVETNRVIQADRGRLQQLLENLLGNAIEHGGAGVTVTLGDVDDGFYVSDDGTGIPASDRDRVFESGYSTTADGTGLGLAIVREIGEAHGWTIAATESEGGGTRFEITGVERSSA